MVTIGDIIEDVNPFTEKGAKVVTVAVVPRDILSEVLEDLEGELHIMKAVERSQYATMLALEEICRNAKARLEEFEGKQGDGE